MSRRQEGFVVASITAALFLFALNAQAEETPLIELSMPNSVNGQIVLTNQPCEIRFSAVADKKLYRAYGIANEGLTNEEVMEGCWFASYPDPKELTPQEMQRAVPVANLLSADGLTIAYKLSDFKPRSENKRKLETI